MQLWILIADESRARVFTLSGDRGAVSEIEGFVHTRGRLSNRDLVSDRPGQVRTGRLGQTMAPIPPHTDPKEAEADRFAAELAKHLRAARRSGAFESLALVAAPKFLGMLRAHLDEPTTRCVVAEVSQDLTRMDGRTLRSHFRELLVTARQAKL